VYKPLVELGNEKREVFEIGKRPGVSEKQIKVKLLLLIKQDILILQPL
jgi:hypothetical protein